MGLKLPPNSLRWIVIAIALVIVVQMVAGPRGFYSLYKLNRTLGDIEDSIVLENVKIDSLTEVESRLENDPIYIERAARELLGVSRPGETVIKFVDRPK